MHLFEAHPEKLALILNHTKLDFDNPVLRETCLMAIKYITEQSEEIRKTITKMVPVN